MTWMVGARRKPPLQIDCRGELTRVKPPCAIDEIRPQRRPRYFSTTTLVDMPAL